MTSVLPVHVIHWNAAAKVLATVDSLRRSSGVDPRITVIDNASRRDEYDGLVSGLPGDVPVLRLERNVGFAGGANVAVREAISRNGRGWFAVAAHDVEVRPDTLGSLIEAAAEAPHHGVVGPVFWDENWESPTSTGGLWAAGGGAYHRAEVDSGRIVDCHWLHGALLLVRTECARAIGGFDERLFAYCEDVDFCLRAGDAGWRVGVVSAAAARESGHTVGQERHSYLITRNSLLLTRNRADRATFARRVARAYRHSLRAAVGSMLPWRSSERRAISRDFARGQFLGVTHALAGRTGPGPSSRVEGP